MTPYCTTSLWYCHCYDSDLYKIKLYFLGLAIVFVVCSCTVLVLYKLEDLAGEISELPQESQQPKKQQPRSSALKTSCNRSSTTLLRTKPACVSKRQAFLDLASEVVLHPGEDKSVVEETAAKLECYYVSLKTRRNSL